MAPIGRWGAGFSKDFWTALAAGEVDAPEIRAVDLLRRTTDPERFRYYCMTGMLPAMGNLTGTIYLVERGGGALELEDGRLVGSWCISIGPHDTGVPGTDHVVVLRNMIEGEEQDFLGIGNRSPIFGEDRWYLGIFNLPDWLPDTYRVQIDEEGYDPENAALLELQELRDKEHRVYPVLGVAGLEHHLRERIEQQVAQELRGNRRWWQRLPGVFDNADQIHHMVDVLNDGVDIGTGDLEEQDRDSLWLVNGEEHIEGEDNYVDIPLEIDERDIPAQEVHQAVMRWANANGFQGVRVH